MNKQEINALLELPLEKLIYRANKVREKFIGQKLELCNIMNAKSGACLEDCKFCAQSSRHKTSAAIYPLKKKEEILKAAQYAKDIGAERFDIVTSGNKLSKDEIKLIADAIYDITNNFNIKICASLGALDEGDFSILKHAGLTRYHHNLETSPAYFKKITTTHNFQDRVETIKKAKRVGLEVCSGGIIGMGETLMDRIEMALCLKDLQVNSVPINALVPIKGTAFENKNLLSKEEVLRTIALFRIILEDKIIKIAAGREPILKNSQIEAFLAGANGMLIGGYLTLKGQELQKDQELIKKIRQKWQREMDS
jgi:biotin synthase